MKKDLYSVLALKKFELCDNLQERAYELTMVEVHKLKCGEISKELFFVNVELIERALTVLGNKDMKLEYDARLKFPTLSLNEALTRHYRDLYLGELKIMKDSFLIPDANPYYEKIVNAIGNLHNKDIMKMLVHKIFRDIDDIENKYSLTRFNSLIDVVLSVEDREDLGCCVIDYARAYGHKYIMSAIDDQCYTNMIKYLAANPDGYTDLRMVVEHAIDGQSFLYGENYKPGASKSEIINDFIEKETKEKGLNFDFKPKPHFYVIRNQSEVEVKEKTGGK